MKLSPNTFLAYRVYSQSAYNAEYTHAVIAFTAIDYYPDSNNPVYWSRDAFWELRFQTNQYRPNVDGDRKTAAIHPRAYPLSNENIDRQTSWVAWYVSSRSELVGSDVIQSAHYTGKIAQAYQSFYEKLRRTGLRYEYEYDDLKSWLYFLEQSDVTYLYQSKGSHDWLPNETPKWLLRKAA